jgi:glycerol-1-phosphate dehydrogenase [NAD(P)+]
LAAKNNSDSEPAPVKKAKGMELPREIILGHDSIDIVGDTCRGLKMKGPALIVADETTRVVAGDAVMESLINNNYQTFIRTISDATIEEVDATAAKLDVEHINFAVGVGGGRPIDVAKLASFKMDIPFVSVPTAASHDGIVSGRASILVGGRKRSYDAHTPFALIADTSIIAQAPKKILAAGCGDLISNRTAVKDWELAHKQNNEEISTYASTLSKMTALVIEKYADIIAEGGEKAAWHVTKALVASGVAMSIAGSSRPCSGAEHMVSHKLDAIAPKPALHGEQCGLAAIMMMKLHGGDWEALKNTLSKIGGPVTTDELGIETEYIIQALTEAQTIRPDRYTILGSGLSEKEARKLAEETGII